ncbi:MAG: hypothetical protein ACJARE_001503 [Paracoccaceae bacterium]|jgi:hypothetical protein
MICPLGPLVATIDCPSDAPLNGEALTGGSALA